MTIPPKRPKTAKHPPRPPAHDVGGLGNALYSHALHIPAHYPNRQTGLARCRLGFALPKPPTGQMACRAPKPAGIAWCGASPARGLWPLRSGAGERLAIFGFPQTGGVGAEGPR